MKYVNWPHGAQRTGGGKTEWQLRTGGSAESARLLALCLVQVSRLQEIVAQNKNLSLVRPHVSFSVLGHTRLRSLYWQAPDIHSYSSHDRCAAATAA